MKLQNSEIMQCHFNFSPFWSRSSFLSFFHHWHLNYYVVVKIVKFTEWIGGRNCVFYSFHSILSVHSINSNDIFCQINPNFSFKLIDLAQLVLLGSIRRLKWPKSQPLGNKSKFRTQQIWPIEFGGN